MCSPTPEDATQASTGGIFKRTILASWCAFMNGTMALEGQGATLFIGMGAWMLFFDMFGSCPSVYRVMLSVAKESTWGVVFIVIGTAQVVVLIRGSVIWRKWVLLVKGALWLFIGVTVLYGEWRAPGVPIYFVLAAGAFRGFLCVTPDKEHAKPLVSSNQRA